ncbi:hypothetical protein ACN42_g7129, partial [Penicillium freii]
MLQSKSKQCNRYRERIHPPPQKNTCPRN